ncbi:MAG: PorT family protein [Bacteroidales bacterium]|nr:PorT family protein [Bacteroidales bacterium]
MKKFFSTLLAASLMLIGTQAFAQTSVNAGYLNSSQSFSESNSNSINSNGAYAGVSFNIPLAGGFGIAPGLYYSMITNKSGSTGSILGIPVSASSTFMEHAVNVPLYLNYNLNLASDSNFFIFAGPTAQYGLASTTKLAGGVGEYSGDKKYDNYDSENYNRFNVYLGGGIGFQVSAIQITLGYDYGLMNLYKGENAIKTHRSNLKLGLGFVF